MGELSYTGYIGLFYYEERGSLGYGMEIAVHCWLT